MGTGSSTSCREEYGCIINANGNRDFLSRELVVGTAFSVERMYLGGQLAFSDAVTLVYLVSCHSANRAHKLTFGGRTIGGGGRSSSVT